MLASKRFSIVIFEFVREVLELFRAKRVCDHFLGELNRKRCQLAYM